MAIEYLNQPPVEEEIVPGQMLPEVFQNYFTNLNGTINSVAKKVTYTLNGVAAQGVVIQFPNYTTDEINSIQNVPNGTMVYDETINKFKFREGGAWVEKQNV